MKILVTYFSQTGNTQKIAEAIHETALKNQNSVLKSIKKVKVNELNEYDLVFIGSTCNDADLAKPVLRFFKKIPKSPKFKLAGFFTHSTTPPEQGEYERMLFEKWAGKCSKSFEQISREKNIDFRGYYRCQGAPAPPIETFIHQTIIQDENEWAKYIEESKKHPDSLDIKKAQEFTQKILNELQ